MIEFEQSWMTLIFHQQHGFCLTYRNPDENTSYAPWMLDHYGDAIRVSTGGQPFYLPETMFVPRDLAYSVVEEFCRTGQRSPAIRWREATTVHWDPEAGKPLNPS